MNPLPPNADELVSAYLDGEAAPHEIDIVESNDELMERVQSLRALTGGLAAPVTPPSEQKEAHIAAALGAFDDLFGSVSGGAHSPTSAAPVLAAIPDLAPEQPTPTPAESSVISLATARERRRPRRFNTSVIAAALAAVLLVGIFAALSGGRSQDVANTSLADSSDTAASDDSTSASDPSMAAVPQDEATEAMDDIAPLELDAARNAQSIAPTAPAQAAELFSADEEAMEEADGDTAAEAEPQAADDAAADSAEGESTTGVEAEPTPRVEPQSTVQPLVPPFDEFLGDFETQDELQLKVETPTLTEFRGWSNLVEPGLFPGCQQDVAELQVIETPTLLGTATLDGDIVEVHILPNEDGDLSLFIVDAGDCVPVTPTP